MKYSNIVTFVHLLCIFVSIMQVRNEIRPSGGFGAFIAVSHKY